MEETLNFLQPICTAVLGFGGICAAIAIIASLIRYFFYQHDDEDRKPLRARFIHVFGLLGAFGVIVGGAPKLITSLTQNNTSQEISKNTGNSFVPNGVNEKTPGYSNLGEALENMQNEENTRSEEYADTVTNNAQQAWSTDENGNTVVDPSKLLSNAFIASLGNGVGTVV